MEGRIGLHDNINGNREESKAEIKHVTLEGMQQDAMATKLLTKKEYLATFTTGAEALQNQTLNTYEGVSGPFYGGISIVKDNRPVVVIPDLHARPDFLAGLMEREIKAGGNVGRVLDLLEAGEVCFVSLGDIKHSEFENEWRNPQNEVSIQASQKRLRAFFRIMRGNIAEPAQETEAEDGNDLLYKQLVRGMQTSKMFTDLIARFPDSCFMVRGNHDSQTMNPFGGVQKWGVKGIGIQAVDQSAITAAGIKKYLGTDFLEYYNYYENLIPSLVVTQNAVISHAAPKIPLTKGEIITKDKKAVKSLGNSLNVGYNATPEDTIEQNIKGILQNLNIETDRLWIVGHKSTGDNNYRLQCHNQLLQLNHPIRQIFAVIERDGTVRVGDLLDKEGKMEEVERNFS